MNTTRVARNASAAVVAGIAAWSSYSHMVGVALAVGERAEVAYVLPLSVDGMLAVASIAMADDKRAGHKPRMSAKVAFVVGVAASMAANVAHAEPTISARIVSAWPALALLLVVELLSRSGRKNAEAVPETAAETASEAAPTASPAPAPVRPATAVTAGRARRGKTVRRPVAQTRQMIAELRADDPMMGTDALARQLKISERRVRQLINQ